MNREAVILSLHLIVIPPILLGRWFYSDIVGIDLESHDWTIAMVHTLVAGISYIVTLILGWEGLATVGKSAGIVKTMIYISGVLPFALVLAVAVAYLIYLVGNIYVIAWQSALQVA